jgi:hypothetical protein
MPCWWATTWRETTILISLSGSLPHGWRQTPAPQAFQITATWDIILVKLVVLNKKKDLEGKAKMNLFYLHNLA